jgi:tetratricopeptide (TPR) repeat protein
MKKLLFLFFFSALLSAKPYEPTQIDLQIISHTFNEEFEQAKKLSQEQINLNPNSPKYYYYLINTKILEYYQRVAELDPEKRDEGRKILNKEIIDYCESIIDKFEDNKLNTENKFYFGTIHAYLGRIYGIDGSWWSAFRGGLKSKNIMEDILKSDPQFYDAYLVLGMLNYYADRLSGITSFIVGILGFSGDREKGLTQLRTAFDKGKLTFGQSALTLIEVYASLEGNEYASLNYFETFLNQFPKNKRTLNAYCQTLMNIGNLKKVETLIKNDKQDLVDYYAKARLYDLKGNSQLAIQFGEQALENEKKLYRGGGTAVRYIIVYNGWLIGDNSKVKKYEPTLNERYKELFAVIKNNEKESKWLRDLSVQIAYDKSIIDIENYVKSKPNFSKAKGFEDQFNLLLGAFYFEKGEFDEAEQYFKRSINAADNRNKYSAVRNLLEIYSRQNVDKSKVKTLLDVIDDMENDRLTYRAKDLEKKYNL